MIKYSLSTLSANSLYEIANTERSDVFVYLLILSIYYLYQLSLSTLSVDSLCLSLSTLSLSINSLYQLSLQTPTLSICVSINSLYRHWKLNWNLQIHCKYSYISGRSTIVTRIITRFTRLQVKITLNNEISM